MGKSKGASAGGLKLNYKRTFLIGFAFFGILLLWQVYDSWCPTFLTVIIAQRINSIMSCDRIVVLDQGRLADMGTHQELLSRSHIYRDVYESQMREGAVDHAAS